MTLALHGKSRTRRTWLLAAALLAVVVGIGGSLMLTNEPTRADSNTIDFEAGSGYTINDINGQNGWSKTGPYDAAVVASGGGQALRISNYITSGSFGDQTLSPSLVNEAGEMLAANGGLSGGTRQSSFNVKWDLSSMVPGSQQPNLAVSLSPDRGDGGRMAFLRMQDDPGGITIAFDDFQAGPAPYTCPSGAFVETLVATNLDRTVPHTVELKMAFLNGRGNDIVRVYVDGVLKHTGTSWEDFYRDCQASPTKTVDQVIIMARDNLPSAAGSNGLGFLIDNLTMTSAPTLPAAPTMTTVVEQEDLVNPLVTPGWFYYDDTLNTVNNALGTMVSGPGTAPLGNGSAEVSTGAGGQVFLNTTQFAGVPLANLTELKYSTYTDAPTFPPFLNINVDFNLTNVFQNRLVFVPSAAAITWQEHDGIQNGAAMWTYSGANWPAPNAAPGTTQKSWSQILADYPNIRVLPLYPQVGVRVGHPGPIQVSHIDKFVWGTSSAISVFDFDPGCTTVCYVRTTGNDANDGSDPSTAKLTIQAGINAVNPGGTVDVGPGTFNEDVVVNNTKNGITLKGAGIDQSIILGTKGDASPNTLWLFGTTGVLVDGFTVTRDGNNPIDWNISGSDPNPQGVSISSGATGNTFRNSKVTGNRNGVYIENSTNNNILNNIIDFNRTGIHFVDNVSGSNVQNNFITNNWTMGVLLRGGEGAINDPPSNTNPTSGITISNNNISGNWYSQIEARSKFGAVTLNAENNWLGTISPTAANQQTSGELGYASAPIPVEYGGTGTPLVPANAVIWNGFTGFNLTNPLDYNPWLCSGTDIDPVAIGFQPLLNCSDIDVTSTSAFVGDTNVQVQVRAISTENLWGVQTYLTYDNTRLTLTGVQLGGGLDPDFVAVNTTSPGLISFAYSQTSGLPANGPSPVVIATLTFTATNTGAATIGYQVGQTQLFSNQLGQPMGPLNKVDGTILITNAPAVFGDIAGIILLQGRGNHSGATVQVDPPGGLISGPSNSSGSVSLTGVASGNHLIQASMLGYLNAVKAVFAVSAGTNSPNTVTLLGGDANMSGIINILDLSLVAAYFGQSPAYAPPLAPNTTPDINGDNVVNILDLSLTAANFGAVGPTSW